MEKNKRRKFWELNKEEKIKMLIFVGVRVIVLLLIVAAIVELALAGLKGDEIEDSLRSRSIFILANSILMLGATFLPSILERTWKVEIPSLMEIIFVVFCFLSLILGEIANFYAKFTWWDSMLHTSSGILITSLGFVVLNTLNESDHIASKMSPIFVCIFAFCFSLAIGALWEIVEWSLDGLNGSNMQRFRDNYTAIPFEGREALRDTMKDIILDASGSFAVALIGYIDLKFKKRFVPNLVLYPQEDKENKNEVKRDGWKRREKKNLRF